MLLCYYLIPCYCVTVCGNVLLYQRYTVCQHCYLCYCATMSHSMWYLVTVIYCATTNSDILCTNKCVQQGLLYRALHSRVVFLSTGWLHYCDSLLLCKKYFLPMIYHVSMKWYTMHQVCAIKFIAQRGLLVTVSTGKCVQLCTTRFIAHRAGGEGSLSSPSLLSWELLNILFPRIY